MLATLGSMPHDPQNYAFEFKWDGYRAICYWDGKKAVFYTRNHQNITLECNFLIDRIPAFGKSPLLLDGEIVAQDSDGRVSFNRLQEIFEFRKAQRSVKNQPLRYMMFDILFIKDTWTTELPFKERRKLLEKIPKNKFWNIPPCRFGEGETILNAAQEQEMEGVIAKRQDTLYYPGKRISEWIKIKFHNRQEFVIGGWKEGEGAANGGIGSILLGYYENAKSKELTYAGNVGTGFTWEARQKLREFLIEHGTSTNPFSVRIPERGVKFTKPLAVAEIEFRGWTKDLKIRQGSFKGIRIDKKPRQVRREVKGVML